MLDRFTKSLRTGPQFERSQPIARAGDIFRWWEGRRLFFNTVVGCTGILTCVLIVVCAFTADSMVGEAIGMPDGPLLGVFGIFFYGLVANICYTGGWICEMLVMEIKGAASSNRFGLNAFRIGVAFSVFLTLLPAVICWLAFAIALAKGQKFAPAGD